MSHSKRENTPNAPYLQIFHQMFAPVSCYLETSVGHGMRISRGGADFTELQFPFSIPLYPPGQLRATASGGDIEGSKSLGIVGKCVDLPLNPVGNSDS